VKPGLFIWGELGGDGFVAGHGGIEGFDSGFDLLDGRLEFGGERAGIAGSDMNVALSVDGDQSSVALTGENSDVDSVF
jgi:hypothetical protein